MAEVLLFHHAQGRTPGVLAFAERLERAGHVVHVPDLYDGRTFDDLPTGIGYAEEIGFGTVIQRGVAAAEALPAELFYVGLSLGVMPAQQLTQTRPGATGAVFVGSCVPVDYFAPAWPEGVPAQIHGMDADPIFVGEGDVDAARGLVAAVPTAELFLYQGDRHLFVDDSLPAFDAPATGLLVERMLGLLATVPG